jgi:hypothetical protein
MDNRLNRNKDITVLHSARTGEWVDIDRDDKIKSLLQKLTWLGSIVLELINMDRHYLGPEWIDAPANKYESLIELLKGKLQQGHLITKSDMQSCNGILKDLKRKYKFNTDWRGNIIDCNKYTAFIFSQAR